MSTPFAGREQDELDLMILRQTKRGVPLRAVAAMASVSFSYVRVIINRTRAADLAESGEPQEIVRSAYR